MPPRSELRRWLGKMLRPAAASPEQILLFVTARCDLRCRHCFYLDTIESGLEEFSLDEIQAVSTTMGSFSFLTVTGGEPFLRRDLPRICQTFSRNNEVRRISIPTNGQDPERIVSLTAETLERCLDSEVTVKISIDGPPEVHDAIRGRRGAFAQAMRTLDELAPLQQRFSNLRRGVLMTIGADNHQQLAQGYHMIRQHRPDVVGLNLARGRAIREPQEPVLAAYRTLYGAIWRDLSAGAAWWQTPFYVAYKQVVRDTAIHVARTGQLPQRCLAGDLLCVIAPDLRIYPCEPLDRSMGCLRDFDLDFTRLMGSPRARQVRREADGRRCHCTHECNIQINTFFDPLSAARLVPRTILGGLGSRRR